MNELIEIDGRLIDPSFIAMVEPHFTDEGVTVIHLHGENLRRIVHMDYAEVRALIVEED